MVPWYLFLRSSTMLTHAWDLQVKPSQMVDLRMSATSRIFVFQDILFRSIHACLPHKLSMLPRILLIRPPAAIWLCSSVPDLMPSSLFFPRIPERTSAEWPFLGLTTMGSEVGLHNVLPNPRRRAALAVSLSFSKSNTGLLMRRHSVVHAEYGRHDATQSDPLAPFASS